MLKRTLGTSRPGHAIPGRAFAILIVLFFALARGDGPDDLIHYTNPFGSDGLNNPGLTAAEYDRQSLDEIWEAYVQARTEILTRIPISKAENQAAYEHSMTVFRESQLLFTMTELRAIIRQKTSKYAAPVQLEELKRIDSVLTAMKIHYVQNDRFNQWLTDQCDEIGTSVIAKSLRPIIYKRDGTPRPIPPFNISY
jgi:hypothetical protein